MTKTQKARRIKQLKAECQKWANRLEKPYSMVDYAICSTLEVTMRSCIDILEATIEIG